MEIYTVEIGHKVTMDDGREIMFPWIELEMTDDTGGTDKWLSHEDPKSAVWPLTGEWTRSASNRRVTLRRRDGGTRLAILRYDRWPWQKGFEGVAELDETFDGEKKAVYVVTQVN
ncbi:hypothetical protein K2Y11_10105 [bacterium]|jgi:hypothetical protein|nr:hypothetical protein [bacterium]